MTIRKAQSSILLGRPTTWLLAGALGITIGACGGPPVVEPPAFESQLAPAVTLPGEDTPSWSIEERMEHYDVPGVSIAVIDEGRIVVAKGYGLADLAEERAVTATTLFQAASISKPVAALGALRLVEEGRLSLDGPVNEALVGWQVPDSELTRDSAVSLRGLLTHTAGMTVWGFPGYPRGAELPTVEQILDGVAPANTDPVRVWRDPGTGFRYSGGGYTVMQKAVEDAAGRPFAEYLADAVLDPAGMSESTFAQPLPQERWSRAARGHRGDGAEVEGEWHRYPELAAAGLWTTPSDLARLAIEVQQSLAGESNRILSREMTEALLTPEPHIGWGLGFELRGEGEEQVFLHTGSNAGFKSSLVAYARRGQGVVVMTNGDQGASLAAEIVRAVASAYQWPTLRTEVGDTISLGPIELAAFVGTYEVPEAGWDIRVTLRSNRLYARSGSGSRSRLYPASPTRFFRVEDGVWIEFWTGPDGQAQSLVLADEIYAQRR
ncbi:MAG: serine hydrolase [Gemmatimonadetes bacterium]|nr:serine hydrolase [Gemmatimonadota bacterium]